MVLNTGVETQSVVLHGTGLDRIEEISADNADVAQVTLGEGGTTTGAMSR